MSLIFVIQYFADIFSCLSYVYAGTTYKKTFLSTNEMFFYSNVYIFVFIILLSPLLQKKYQINIFNIKTYIKNRSVVYATFLTVVSGIIKTLLLGNIYNISQLTLRGFSILCPFITIILCHIYLKDQKINKKFFICLLFCLVGLAVFNNISYQDFLVNYKVCFLVLLYVAINSFADYKIKSISKQRGIDMMFFDNLMFLFVACVVFFVAIFFKKLTLSIGVDCFDFKKLIDKNSVSDLFVVAFLSFFAHNFKMLSFKKNHIMSIVIIGILFKCFNSGLMDYIQKASFPSVHQVIGVAIMCLSFAFFNKSSKKVNK
jgi:hypothetical protein